MKKKIRKWLGLGDVGELERKVGFLQVTCDNLMDKSTKYNAMLEECEPYLRELFDGGSYDRIMSGDDSPHSAYISSMAKSNIEDANKKKKIKDFPALKERVVLHGGCLGCVTPINKGLGACQGCLYFHGVRSNFPNLKENG